jgi:flagellar assembly protein FliH
MMATDITSGNGPEFPASRKAEHANAGGKAAARVEPLRYLSLDEEGEPEVAEIAETEPQTNAEVEKAHERLAAKESEWMARAEAIRKDAYAAGRASAEGDRAAKLSQMAGQWEKAVQQFLSDRDRYFARVEREVVELALAIAARILQREAQLDPLLLSGAVRVALGQLGETTSVRLRVPVSAHGLWSETLRLMPNLPVHPELVADSEMQEGDAVLETRLGRVDLGVRAQLKEIERGFFDLLSHREPAAESKPRFHGRH